ncbi:MAG TPA: hypothetical protein ENJ54_07185 [Chloroflexi bacterium]|nr:hypothetical protein [Chloroflexota bacterium]
MPQAWITPNLAYLLLMSGTVVLILALITPGTGMLELSALFLLLAAGYTATQLAVNAWAVAVWIVGIVFFGLSLRRGRREGVWLALALLAMMVGSVFIFRTPDGGSAVSPWLAVTVSLLVGGSGWLVARKVLEAETRPPVHDLERLIGQVGEARTDIAPEGSVYLDGEMWTARSEQPIPAGTRVRVLSREGLILEVEPWHEENPLGKECGT